MVDNAFEPATVVVAAGQPVKWTNHGALPHTVTSSDQSFDSGVMEPGAEFRMSFDVPGSYPYICTLHPEMTGTVNVVAPAPRVDVASVVPVAASDPPSLGVAIALSMTIVAAMAVFTIGMSRFAKAAEAERSSHSRPPDRDPGRRHLSDGYPAAEDRLAQGR